MPGCRIFMIYTLLFLFLLFAFFWELQIPMSSGIDLEYLRKIFVDWTFIHWIMSGYGGITIFIIGWLIRMQSSQNRSSTHIASLSEANRAMRDNISEIKQNSKEIREDVKSVNREISSLKNFINQKLDTYTKVVQDQKEMNTSSEIRINSLLKKLDEKEHKKKKI